MNCITRYGSKIISQIPNLTPTLLLRQYTKENNSSSSSSSSPSLPSVPTNENTNNLIDNNKNAIISEDNTNIYDENFFCDTNLSSSRKTSSSLSLHDNNNNNNNDNDNDNNDNDNDDNNNNKASSQEIEKNTKKLMNDNINNDKKT